MPTSNRSDFRHLLRSASRTARTAVYGPVRTVVWEGRSREAPPYPDLWVLAVAGRAALGLCYRFQSFGSANSRLLPAGSRK